MFDIDDVLIFDADDVTEGSVCSSGMHDGQQLVKLRLTDISVCGSTAAHSMNDAGSAVVSFGMAFDQA